LRRVAVCRLAVKGRWPPLPGPGIGAI